MADLVNVLLSSSLTTSFANDNVPYFKGLVVSWQWTPGCASAIWQFVATTLTFGNTNYASAFLTANYASLPSMLGTYNYSSASTGSSKFSNSDPPTILNNTNPATLSGFSVYHDCNQVKDTVDFFTNHYPYCVWISSGTINTLHYYHILWEENSSSAVFPCSNYYPCVKGNTSVSITLQNNGTAGYVTAMSVDLINSSSNVNLANTFVDNYEALLYQSINDLGNQLMNVATGNYGSTNKTMVDFGVCQWTAGVSLTDLSGYLHSDYSAVGNAQVQHITSLILNFKGTSECYLAIVGSALIEAGVTIVLLVVPPAGAVLEIVVYGLIGVSALFTISQECLTISYG